MNKIFKYRWNYKTGEVEMPEDAKVIRCAFVDDGFYFGDFVWAIVDPTSLNVQKKLSLPRDWSLNAEFDFFKKGVYGSVSYRSYPLKVKEKQKIVCGKPMFVSEEDGTIMIYCEKGKGEQYEIAFFKTGQEIDIDINEWEYLGLARLWIIQELGLYTWCRKVR
jgi:hypothetical protein